MTFRRLFTRFPSENGANGVGPPRRAIAHGHSSGTPITVLIERSARPVGRGPCDKLFTLPWQNAH